MFVEIIYQIKHREKSLKYDIVKEEDVELMDELIMSDDTISSAHRDLVGDAYNRKYWKILK